MTAAVSSPFPEEKIATLRRSFGEWAASTYAGGDFPHREMEAIRQAGLLTLTLPGEPLDGRRGYTAALLRLLREIGRGNLSVGRIYEGHLNALQLIRLYGRGGQKERWYAEARAGHLFGVWNTEMADGIHFRESTARRWTVSGSKSFCSGSTYVTRPLITGVRHGATGTSDGWQMAVVPLDEHQPPVDRDFWNPVGMRNSVSYKIDFSGIRLGEDDLLGKPGEYNLQPHFSGGAIRFAAVQLGGAAALLDATRDYLRQLQRTENPYQRTRVGRMAILVESGALWLERAGEINDGRNKPEEIVHYANMTRTAIAGYCKECLNLAEACVGARGLLHPQSVARLHCDLSMYLRQPAPDATLEAVGEYTLHDPKNGPQDHR
jgi:alkylation response protein AidB-like acyl-CoA dehydrogenase